MSLLDLVNKSPSKSIGLDISSTSVKALEISRIDTRFRVENFSVVSMPANAVVEKSIKDLDAVASAIRQLDQSITAGRQANVAVADSSVITKVIQMDAGLNENDMESQVVIEADRYIPYPLEEVSLDYEVLGASSKDADLIDVLVIASRTENVQTLINAVAEGGMDVKLVDVESYALERACRLIADQLPDGGENQTIAVIDIGATMTTLTVLSNLVTIFTREEVFGGEQLTKQIQRHYGLSYAEAGKVKKHGGLSDDYNLEVLTPFKESVVLQVRHSLQFFFSASQYTEIDHIVLAGGTAMIPGLAALVEEQMGVSTTIANPFLDMVLAQGVDAVKLTDNAPAMMIAVGLAMREDR